MNVMLNPGEVNAVLGLVTSRLLDSIELSEEGQEAVRTWRSDRGPGTDQLDDFADRFNNELMDFIDESTRRRTMRGGRFERETARERWS
ncbi:MAG: hypothetical protein F4X26_08710 [Chloroflexi bacterium]|nr:hypothetical protein [Chloroflexota bacterium]MYD66038.1 hypothetical protein [Chloroflexota bacterium]